MRPPLVVTRDPSLADTKLVGEEAFDWAGWSVSGAGDVDGDGHDDLLISSFWHDPGGIAYLVHGGGLFESASIRAHETVGVAGFEPAAPCSQTRRFPRRCRRTLTFRPIALTWHSTDRRRLSRGRGTVTRHNRGCDGSGLLEWARASP
jgi:hypothetical protein